MEDDSDSNNPCHHPSISIRVNRACLRSAQSTAGVLFCACFWVRSGPLGRALTPP